MSVHSNNNGNGDVAAANIGLNETETILKTLLLDVAKYINPQNPCQLRFTGGWVRDKLLGVGSHDIDVAIDVMTGYQFGLKMKEYLEIPGNSSIYGLHGIDTDDAQPNGTAKLDQKKLVSGLHKIEANPEKSKHLETVTTRVFGLDIDLVNLRKETYTDDSRNPQMEFGTPEEDALRRDATINAMFYNLQTEKIEDFTGRGFDDMKHKVIRTPLEPYQTFKDDPLRVLRLIRFASRLDYAIDPEAERFMGDATIKEALKVKISRERVGVEVEKMLKGPRPLMALELIDRMSLYTTIFTDPTVDQGFKPDTTLWSLSYSTIHKLGSEPDTLLASILLPDEDRRYIAWNLSAFVPFADAPSPTPPKVGGKAPPPLAVSAAREGIKATNKFCEILTLAVRNVEEITSAKDAFLHNKDSAKLPPDIASPAAADTLGMAIRRWGPTWLSQVVFALLVEVTEAHGSERDVLGDYEKFLLHIKSLNLLEAYDLRPIIDGKALAKALDTRPGPWMKDALDVVMAWQLRNPGVTSPDAAIAAVRDTQSELTTALIRHVLQLTIRPLFSKTPPAHVTRQGRAALAGSTAPRRLESIDDEASARPWKRADNAHALNLLGWAVRSLDAASAELFWPLLVPPILTLLDDAQPRYKMLGCDLLRALLRSTPPALLSRTGLGNVLHDATTPCLSYLPSLTPEAESIPLLDAAYPALFDLVAVRFPSPSTTSNPRIQTLTTLLHTSLLPSLTHTLSTHPRLATTLLLHLSTLILHLGTDTIAHLSALIPLLATILATPLAAAAHPPLLAAAARAMQAVLACAWPRAGVWRGEVLLGICKGWVQVVEEVEAGGSGKGELGVVEGELRVVVRMLVAALDVGVGEDGDGEAGVGGNGAKLDVRAELRLLLEADGRLEGLFEGMLDGEA